METWALLFALFTTKSTEIRDKNMPFYERKKICLNFEDTSSCSLIFSYVRESGGGIWQRDRPPWVRIPPRT